MGATCFLKKQNNYSRDVIAASVHRYDTPGLADEYSILIFRFLRGIIFR